MKIREDNATLTTLFEDLQRERVTIKEYVTRSEHSAFFTTLIDKKVLDEMDKHPSVYTQVFDVINKGDNQGRTINFPTLYGINPVVVPELSEIPFGDIDSTSTDVQAVKFGIRMGLSQEMIDDNEVGLMEWTIRRVGQRMGILRDQESFKALFTWHSATGGASVDSTLNTHIGNENRGLFYTTGTFTNGVSASAGNWEDILNTGLNVLKNQTITFQGRTYHIPVYADTIIANSVRDITLKKVLRSSTVVQATGIADAGNAQKTQVAGSNVWNGAVNVITTPFCARGSAYLTKAKRGLVFLERKAPTVDRKANWAFDAEEVKATTRFMPAVVEERSIFHVCLGTA